NNVPPAPVAKDSVAKQKPSQTAAGEGSPTVERLRGDPDVGRGSQRKQTDSNKDNALGQDNSENGSSVGHGPSQQETANNRKHANRFQSKMACPRGHARRGRGGIYHHRPEYPEAHQQRVPKTFEDRGKDVNAVNAVNAGAVGKHVKGKNSYQQQRNRRKNVTDGLAGLDINNIASVVVIDDHLVDAVSVDMNEEFEEVLNKRAKKQKAHEMQQKMEAEEKRKAREKERQIRAQAKKLARQNNLKKGNFIGRQT
ncbi:unnamed protein product, partial [Heligmosomoides polygyrus]|uniref:60S ribosomal protein L29 n=1 Tax=Heligmosomoides polygyrus TaxID=6339 RepID=A0A183FD49_HELPZ